MKDENTILPVIGCMAEMLFHTLAKRLSGHVTHHLLNSKLRWGWFLKVLIRDPRFWTNTFPLPEMPAADWTNIGMCFTSIRASWAVQSGISLVQACASQF